MKLALISPRGSFFKNQSLIELNQNFFAYKNTWTGLSSALLTVAALTPPEYGITLMDENVETIDFNIHYDLVGISMMTQQAIRAYEIADEFRSRGITVVIGGIHATVMPDEAAMHADSVIVGEAESLWPDFIRDFEHKRLKKIYRTERKADLKEAPLPRYDLIKDKGYKTIWIQTTRGCPHDCEFCAASRIFGKQYRRKSVAQVITEVNLVKSIIGNQMTIGFSDDNFFVDESYALELLTALIPLQIRWVTQSDIAVAEKVAILELLKPSGCYFLFIGFESIHEANLKGLDTRNWKLRQLQNYPDNIQKLQTRGIPVHGSFIIGLDNDNQDVFESLMRFIIDNYLADVSISILTPFPGTVLRERLEKEHRILNRPWDFYTMANVNIIHTTLSQTELEAAIVDIYQTVHAPEVYQRKMEYFKNIYRNLDQQMKEGSAPHTGTTT